MQSCNEFWYLLSDVVDDQYEMVWSLNSDESLILSQGSSRKDIYDDYEIYFQPNN